MNYRVEFTEKALKELKKLDKSISLMITAWIRKNLDGCDNPRLYGKELSQNHAGKWRYRIGNYRMITDIQDEKLLILALKIGHRKEIY